MKICIFDKYFIKEEGTHKECINDYDCDSCEIKTDIQRIIRELLIDNPPDKPESLEEEKQ